MKKILSLLTLLVAVCSGAWAAELCSAALPNFNADGSSYKRSSGSLTGTNCTLAWSGINSGNVVVNDVVYWKFDSGTYAQLTLTSGSFQAGDILTVNMYNQSSSGTKEIGYTLKSTSGNVAKQNVAKQTVVNISYTLQAADIEDDGSIKIYRGGSASSDARFYSFSVSGTRGPSISTQPVGASYVSGATINPLTVEATGTGTLTYQWYSCEDADKTNAAAIDGATSISYTPTAAGFYYVTVTDGNNVSVDSNVVEITVSAAAAPTINVSGAPDSNVKVGTEVTLTATVTGVPVPTLQWYSNTTASTTGSTAIAGATSETYAPSTDAAGTYYYYAVATNSEGEATSAVQTIVVKEQVATPAFTPNGAYFENSQEVTLACTTTGATIKYSTDNGATWTDYTTALNFSETTTVQAKATKDDYIDSEVATATFNKVTLDAWTNVTGAATWDWSKFGTKEIKLTDSTTPKKNDEFVLSNVVNYGYCSSISSEFGDAQALKVSGEYAVRDTKYFQGGFVKFHPTVAGKLSVTYSNTGGRTNEDDRRFLNVNGTDYGEGTMNTTAITTSDIYVPANNDVTIKGTLKGDGSDQYLRINKIEFTPLTETTVAVSDKLYRTFASKYPTTWGSISGLTAYKATVIGDNVTFEEVTGSVPAGEGLLLKATEAKTYTVPVSSSLPDDINNALVGVTKDTTVEGAGIFVLYADDTHPIGFYKTEATSFTVGANTAYLPANTSARTFIALDEETTGIGASLMNSERVNNEVYNLNGQRVAQPTKGLYIVNGKKVVIK